MQILHLGKSGRLFDISGNDEMWPGRVVVGPGWLDFPDESIIPDRTLGVLPRSAAIASAFQERLFLRQR
jgi:hypothetical protein